VRSASAGGWRTRSSCRATPSCLAPTTPSVSAGRSGRSSGRSCSPTRARGRCSRRPPGCWGRAHQVWLAAWVPDPGANFLEDTGRNLEAAFDPGWIGQDPIEDDAVAAAFLYHDCDDATRTWALSTRRLSLPLGVYGERLALAPEVPSTYVVAAHDRTIRPEWQRRMARERLGVEPVELPTGHCPNVSRPDRLAELLVEVAERA
jgi:pimeloyl-ACP methyl ester carboxylesterase